MRLPKKSKTGIKTPKADIDLIHERLKRLKERLRLSKGRFRHHPGQWQHVPSSTTPRLQHRRCKRPVPAVRWRRTAAIRCWEAVIRPSASCRTRGREGDHQHGGSIRLTRGRAGRPRRWPRSWPTPRSHSRQAQSSHAPLSCWRDPAGPTRLAVTQAELAEAANLSRNAAGTILRGFVDRGFVETDYRGIVVRDSSGLRRFVME